METLETLHQVIAAIGDAQHPWVGTGSPVHLVKKVYPVPGGAVVVERTPPSVAAPLQGTQQNRDRGAFRVYRVSVEGEVERLSEKTWGRRGAEYWAQRYAQRLCSHEA